jgi:hypothetical protein
MVTLLMRSHAEEIFLAFGHERRMANIEATFCA